VTCGFVSTLCNKFWYFIAHNLYISENDDYLYQKDRIQSKYVCACVCVCGVCAYVCVCGVCACVCVCVWCVCVCVWLLQHFISILCCAFLYFPHKHRASVCWSNIIDFIAMHTFWPYRLYLYEQCLKTVLFQ